MVRVMRRLHAGCTIVTHFTRIAEVSKVAERESKPPTVAVVMATFNRGHLISQAIDSLLDQTRPPDQIIVVNDGSTDDTECIVRGYGDRVEYLKKSNGGKPAALNFALPHVASDYVWVFDDDDVALSHALESHLSFLAENPQLDFSYSTNYEFSGSFSEKTLEGAKLKVLPPLHGHEYFLSLMHAQFLPSLMQGMLIPTRCYREIGGFDEALARNEDVEILLRIARRFRGGYLDVPTFALREHDGARGPSSEQHAYADRYDVFRQYNRYIFRRLRATLPLCEYLPDTTATAAVSGRLGEFDERRALLERALVMAIHGLFAEAAEDFAEYTRRLDEGAAALTAEERRRISALANADDPDMMPPADYYRRIGEASRGRIGLLRAAMRGLYWSITREARKRRLANSARLVGGAAALGTGYVGFAASAGAGRGRQ